MCYFETLASSRLDDVDTSTTNWLGQFICLANDAAAVTTSGLSQRWSPKHCVFLPKDALTFLL